MFEGEGGGEEKMKLEKIIFGIWRCSAACEFAAAVENEPDFTSSCKFTSIPIRYIREKLRGPSQLGVGCSESANVGGMLSWLAAADRSRSWVGVARDFTD